MSSGLEKVSSLDFEEEREELNLEPFEDSPATPSHAPPTPSVPPASPAPPAPPAPVLSSEQLQSRSHGQLQAAEEEESRIAAQEQPRPSTSAAASSQNAPPAPHNSAPATLEFELPSIDQLRQTCRTKKDYKIGNILL